MSAPRSLPKRALGAARKAAPPGLKRAIRRTGGTVLVKAERRRLRPQLSVVMPVYNVAEYLPAALDSVLTQSLHDLEVIAVDDGSTDNCLEILRDYERRDGRVRVFTQTNSGQGPARNLGVTHARAEFLTFMDSDDTIPPTAYEHMVTSLGRSGSDFSVGGVRRFRHNEYIRHVWARTVHASDRIGITLDDFPNAMQDIIACNRMFRTEFWRERIGEFRGHIAYEDHVPMLAAYVRAEKFDILSEVTYNWRIRENLTSTGQQKARLENLLDRIAVKEEAHHLLKEEASEDVYDMWVGRTIEVDFPPFITHALAGNDLYRNILSSVYQTFTARASQQALSFVRVYQKVRGALVAQGRWEDLAAADAWFADVRQLPPAHVENGRVIADLPEETFTAGLPAYVREWSSLESHFEGVLEHVEWPTEGLQLTGWAIRRGVPTGAELAQVRAWLRDDQGGSLELGVTPTRLPEANIWVNQPFVNGDGGGFVAVASREDLAAQGPRTWHLEVEVTYAGLTSSGTVLNRVLESAPLIDSAASLPGGLEATTRWARATGFSLDVAAPRIEVLSLTTDEGRGEIAGVLRTGGIAPELSLVGMDGDRRAVTATPGADGLAFRATMPQLAGVSPDKRGWTLQARVAGRQVPVLWPQTSLEDDAFRPSGHPAAGAAWRRTQSHRAELLVGVPEFALDAVDLVGDTVLLRVLRRGLTEAQAEAVRVENARDSLALLDATHDDDVSTLTFSLQGERFGTPQLLPAAAYDVVVDVPGGTLRATTSATYSGRMPQRLYTDLIDLKVGHDPAGLAKLRFAPPLRADEVGTFHVRRLQDAYRTKDVTPTDSVFFQSYRGEFACDSQLALDRGLAASRPDLTRYWGVQDRATQVPDGAVPVIMGSREWYDAIASSRFLCNNIDFGDWFRLRPHQRYLQTFHGYPFKSMGLGFWRSKGLTDDEIAGALLRANREWDTILVPSDECAQMYAEQYGWQGHTLVAGYPRTDVLLTGDTAAIRAKVLSTLGVEDTKRVVLYAPTYRDKLTTRTYAAARFDELDLDALTSGLGEDYVLLLRGHNNNQRELDRVSGKARVIDVTDWPDINELTIAADVAVLDYSSLRFDWAVTGKPMVFFVPDREEYFALRPPLFPFESSAPGPWAVTTAQVISELRDLDSLRQRHGADIEAFNARFNSLQDGHATDRVIAEFFADHSPSSTINEGSP